jgi:hypothetical protein
MEGIGMLRDDSPYREPGIDANRRPKAEIYDDSRCDCCGTTEKLGIVGEWVLCVDCERKHYE